MQLDKAGIYGILAAGGVTGELARCMAAGSYAESMVEGVPWNTDARGDQRADGFYCSRGLWQINVCGGVGQGYDADLLEGDVALQVALMRTEYAREFDRWTAEGYTGVERAVRVCCWAEKPFGFLAYDGPAAQGYRAGYAAAAPEPEPSPGYDPDTPSELQLQDWTCSVRSTCWALRALGSPITAGELQDQMQADGLVDPEVGLRDGSGTSLARWLTATCGVRATATYPADWAAVQDYAGTGPILLGGLALNHWVAVRRPTADADALDIMNPAPNWHGIGTELTQAEWDTWGPWAAIAVAGPEEETALSAEERAELEELRIYMGTLLGTKAAPGGLVGSVLTVLEEAANGKSSRAELANVVRGQVRGLREAAGLPA